MAGVEKVSVGGGGASGRGEVKMEVAEEGMEEVERVVEVVEEEMEEMMEEEMEEEVGVGGGSGGEEERSKTEPRVANRREENRRGESGRQGKLKWRGFMSNDFLLLSDGY